MGIKCTKLQCPYYSGGDGDHDSQTQQIISVTGALPIAVIVKFIVAGESDKHTETSPQRVENLSGSFNPNLPHMQDNNT